MDERSTRVKGTAEGWPARLLPYGCLLLFTALAVAYRGYLFGHEDQHLYLPFVMKWLDPSLFPHDYLLDLGYARQSVTWVALAALSRVIGMKASCAVLYAAASYLVLLLTYLTARAWWRSEAAAWVAVLLWLPDYAVPGVFNATFDRYLTTRVLGTVCGMALLLGVFRGRSRGVGAWVFAGGLVHIVSAVPPAVGAALASALGRRWRTILWIAGGTVASGVLLLVLSGGRGPSPFLRYTAEWTDLVRASDSELFPHRWASSVWFRWAAYAVPFFALFFYRRWCGETLEGERQAARVNAGIFSLFGVGLAGSVLGLALVIQFCFFRGMLFFMWLTAIYLAGLIAPVLSGDSWLSCLLAGLVAGCWLGADPVMLLCMVPVLVIGTRWPVWESAVRARLPGWRLPAAAVLLVTGLLFAPKLSFYLLAWNMEEWLRTSPGVWMGLGTAGILLLARRALGPIRSLNPLVLAVCAALLFAIFPSLNLAGWIQRVPELRRLYGPRIGHGGVRAAAAERDRREREQLGRIVREAVPVEATVLVPPSWDWFRLAAARSSFVTFKDGAPAEFDWGYAQEWRARMDAINPGRSQDLSDQAPALTDDRVRAIGKAYAGIHLEYVISDRGLGLPAVASSGRWTLYRIDLPEEARSP